MNRILGEAIARLDDVGLPRPALTPPSPTSGQTLRRCWRYGRLRERGKMCLWARLAYSTIAPGRRFQLRARRVRRDFWRLLRGVARWRSHLFNLTRVLAALEVHQEEDVFHFFFADL